MIDPKEIFFEKNGLDENKVRKLISDCLKDTDDGEIFFEYTNSESIVFDEGTLKSSSYDTMQGFGLRGILGETVAYSHSSLIDIESIKKASENISYLKNTAKSYKVGEIPKRRDGDLLYRKLNPIDEIPLVQKVDILKSIDEYLRSKDSRVKQVTASIAGECQIIYILRGDGFEASDIRPLVRVNISVIVEQNGRKERGSFGMGGRNSYDPYFDDAVIKNAADEALREACINLESIDSPAGEMDVVLGSGWPGILLHEAIGHGLEGDFNRKKTSAFSNLLGQRVAAEGITVIDDGTVQDRRGSLNIDDEGTACQRNVLIEDGILVNYMQDRLNARLMGMKPTGNGRRESYEHCIMPRMTNTYMLNGDKEQEELISAVKNGIYAVSFGGGQVDITNGKFVFSASEAYKIENGKITAPVKGATLIGNGPDALTKVKAVANDMSLDPGIGTCGKDGQGVPVGVGQPSILIGGLTVGGTEVS